MAACAIKGALTYFSYLDNLNLCRTARTCSAACADFSQRRNCPFRYCEATQCICGLMKLANMCCRFFQVVSGKCSHSFRLFSRPPSSLQTLLVGNPAVQLSAAPLKLVAEHRPACPWQVWMLAWGAQRPAGRGAWILTLSLVSCGQCYVKLGHEGCLSLDWKQKLHRSIVGEVSPRWSYGGTTVRLAQAIRRVSG